MKDIETALPLITDTELIDNCKSLLGKLDEMSDEKFEHMPLKTM